MFHLSVKALIKCKAASEEYLIATGLEPRLQMLYHGSFFYLIPPRDHGVATGNTYIPRDERVVTYRFRVEELRLTRED